MKLSQILSGIEAKIIGSKHRNISGLYHVASECKSGSIFFCLKGRQNNGADYIAEAIKNGAKVIVTEEASSTKHITQVIVPNARKAMSQMAANFYGNAADRLKIIGVTGTNGKTSVCHMVAHILKDKYNVGIIGTNGAEFNKTKIQTNMTTPDPIMLHEIFAKMEQNGVEVVAMEMSAHAIFLHKLWGIMPHIIAFTNLSQDHLDYFENMQTYYNAKASIFEGKNYTSAVVCVDTGYGKQIAAISKNVTTCATVPNQADIFVSDIKHTTYGQTFDCTAKEQTQNIELHLFGKFNLQNAIVAVSICKVFGLSLAEIAANIATFEGVDGRYDCITCGNQKIIIDYAHTPDGLNNLLASIRQLAPKDKLVCVFGCGGNRDTQKRALMGTVAEKYADYVIVTTDNPRFEDNYKIAEDIICGFSKKKYEILLDRGQAIRRSIDLTQKGGIVVIAGKGAENYIEIGSNKIEFNDKKFVKSILN